MPRKEPLKKYILNDYYKNFKIPIAYDKDKNIIDIKNTESGEVYTCVSCGNELITKKGDVRKHHFAHKNVVDCDKESILHEYVKYKIKKNGFIIIRNTKINFRNCEEEVKIDKFYADLVAETEYGMKIVIEIEVTHENSLEKEDFYKNNLIPHINIKVPLVSIEEIDMFLESPFMFYLRI